MSSSPHCFVGAVQKFATKRNTEIWGAGIGPDQSFAKKKIINQKIENEVFLEVFQK
jgi:hypothetical protein